MAIAFVQDGAKHGESAGDGVIADTYGSSTTTGNLLVAMYWAYSGSSVAVGFAAGSVTDNKSNTWVQAREHEVSSGVNNWGSAIYYCENATGGSSHTVTLDVGSTAATIYGVIAEFSGIATSSALDKVNSANTAASPAVTGLSGTLSQADELVCIVAALSTDDSTTSISVGGGFTQLAEEVNDVTNQAGEADYLIVAATTSLQGSWTVADAPSNASPACIATFKAAASGTAVKDIIGGGIIPFAR